MIFYFCQTTSRRFSPQRGYSLSRTVIFPLDNFFYYFGILQYLLNHLSIPINIQLTKMKKIRVIGLLCGLYCSGLHAQDPIRYKFRHIFPKSGLSSIFMRKIIQDPYGFLWIGTQDGLNRYDGKNFIIYNTGLGNNRFITGSDIRGLMLDTANRLIWEINSYGGIDAIDYGTGLPVYHYFQTRDKSTANLLFTSLALLGGRLFIGSTNGVFIVDTREKKLQKMELADPFHKGGAELFIDNVLADNSGNIWLFGRNLGVVLLRNGNTVATGITGLEKLEKQKGSGIRFYDCSQLRDGRILAATSLGLRAFSADGRGGIQTDNNPFPGIPVSQGRNIYSCRQDRKGYTWFSSPGYLVRTKGPDAFSQVIEHTSRDEFNWLAAVYTIFFDKEDDVWLGCQQGLAYAQNRPSGFASMHGSSLTDASIQHAYYLGPVNDTLLYCCAQEGLYEVHPSTGVILQLARGRPFYHVVKDPYGRLIASDIDGVFIVSGRQLIPLEKLYPEFRPLAKLVINSHCYIGDSLIVFGTENDRGIVAWNYKRRRAFLIDQHTPGLWLKENTVNTVFKDAKGRVWVLGDISVSLLDFSAHTVQIPNLYSSSQNKFYSIFFDVCQVKGLYYLASYGAGVLVLDEGLHIVRQITVKDGLAGNSVYKILPWKDSLLFVTSNNGLSAIAVRDHHRIKNYYESDGLHSNNFEENSGAIQNNILYAGGPDGFSIVDISSLPPPSARPKLYLRQVKIETGTGVIDTSNILLTHLEIPNNEQQTTVYFSSLNYPNPERSVFSYRIKELNVDWISIGTQDFVTLIGLNPGQYTLQVQSVNEDGFRNEQPIELILVFLPKWYQTLWFKFLILVAISALLYAFFLYRIGQLKKQQQIRKDIASDLHDDIGSILNTVKIFTHLARKDQQKEDYLTRIEESLAQATMGLRDMIWVLDDTRDTIRELSERIKKFAVPVMAANNIHFECIVSEEVTDHLLSKTEKRNLLLIAKETINNSLKYAECRNICVSVHRENNKLYFSIYDDGKGFDADNPELGNGLKNIGRRARQINFDSCILSSAGNGTRIIIREI